MPENKQTAIDDIVSGGSSVQSSITKNIKVADFLDDVIISNAEEKGYLTEGMASLSLKFKNDSAQLNKSLDEMQALRDKSGLTKSLNASRISGSDEDILEGSQKLLRLTDFEKSIGTQLESEQLAQRQIFRDQQANIRSQNQLASQGQQAQAQIANRSAQSGFGSSSALQGLSSSVGTQIASQTGVLQTDFSDLRDDSTRLSANLIENIDYLNTTFDLGGDISGANQNILQQQANDEASAAKKKQLIGSISSGATIGASFGGPTGAVVGAGVGLLASIFG